MDMDIYKQVHEFKRISSYCLNMILFKKRKEKKRKKRKKKQKKK